MSESTIKKPKKRKKKELSTGEKVKQKLQDQAKKKKVSDRTEAAARRASTGEPSTARQRESGSVLPQVKRRRSEGSSDESTMEVVAPPRRTTFQIAKRTGLGEMTKVKLLPHVVTKDGRLTGISFGRNRTPSPFGSRMGDHTGSWTSVVDSVHARLYGKDLGAAVAELTDMQRHAQEWMSDGASTGMKLWNLLDPADQDSRRPVLENYAYTVNDLLTKARGLLETSGDSAEARNQAYESVAELLAEATAHHLAFLNFLPFATVPAKGDSGSKGSGEGTARAKVLDIELDVEAELQRRERAARTSKATTAEPEEEEEETPTTRETPEQTRRRVARELAEAQAARKKQLADAHDGLWGLFSMEAAVRAADLDRVVAPKRIARHGEQLKQLQELASEVQSLLPGFILPPAETDPDSHRKRRRLSAPPKRGSDSTAFTEKIKRMLRTATGLQGATDLPYREVTPLTTELVNAIQHMQGITKKVSAGESDVFEIHKAKIEEMAADLDKLVSRLSADPDATREESALLLAHLLYDHQTTVARAYPNAVEQTKFLGDDPEQAKQLAASRVFAHITDRVKGILGVENEQADLLVRKMTELYAGLGPAPTPGPNTRWVADSRTASLVAAFKGETLTLQGRPAAPPAVGGMGSHTTAWVTEESWMRKRLAEVGKGKIVEALRSDAMIELNGDLMTKLAQHLPAEQLAAGQLGMIFDAAVDVMAATEPAEAITAYLSFRNLLPYATVDAGNRGGQAERVGSDKATLFDSKSLNAAIDQKLDELGPSRLKGTIKTLRSAADSLAKDLAATDEPAVTTAPDADPPEPTWKSFPQVKDAITATIGVLREEADRLASAKDTNPAAGVRKAIVGTRSAEHSRVYNYANT